MCRICTTFRMAVELTLLRVVQSVLAHKAMIDTSLSKHQCHIRAVAVCAHNRAVLWLVGVDGGGEE